MLAISIRNQPKMPAIPVYGICNQPVLISGCAYGKISVLFMISVTNLHFSEIEGSGPKSRMASSFAFAYILWSTIHFSVLG